jgi:hypothetical protein
MGVTLALLSSVLASTTKGISVDEEITAGKSLNKGKVLDYQGISASPITRFRKMKLPHGCRSPVTTMA